MRFAGKYACNGLNLLAELDGENYLLASYQHAPGTIDMPVSMSYDMDCTYLLQWEHIYFVIESRQ